MQRTKMRNTEANEDELYPGVSSQKRVKTIRAEQLFKEEQAKTSVQKEAAVKRKIHHKLLDDDEGNLEQGKNNKNSTDKVNNKDKVNEQQLTCIISVGHEVARINDDTKCSNKEQDNDEERAATN
eukprot:14994191-Heterocapsa_arctica.AAC.1